MTLPGYGFLSGVRAKLERADRHTADLHAELAPLIKHATDSIVREDEGDPSKILYRVTNLPILDPALSTLVGDALNNIRSALDHLAWRLVELDGGTPNENTQFPILPKRPGPKGQIRQTTIRPGINRADILDAINQVQPYKRTDIWMDTFWVLRHLNVVDKHRLLLVMVTTVDIERNVPWWGIDSDVPSPGWWFNTRPLNSGEPVARFDFHGTPARADFDPHITLAVTLDEGPPGSWMRTQDVVSVLAGLRFEVTRQINWRFGPLFPEPQLPFPPRLDGSL